MERITQWILRHKLMFDIHLDDFYDSGFHRQNRQGIDQRQNLISSWIISCTEFVKDRFAGYSFEFIETTIPLSPSPVSLGNHFGFCTDFMVETWNGCLDIDSGFHEIPFLTRAGLHSGKLVV